MHAYLGGIIRHQKGVAEAIGGVEDHVQLLISLPTTHCIANVMRDLKKDSSTWIANNFSPDFRWQEGHAVFSVRTSNVAASHPPSADRKSTPARPPLMRNSASFSKSTASRMTPNT